MQLERNAMNSVCSAQGAFTLLHGEGISGGKAEKFCPRAAHTPVPSL